MKEKIIIVAIVVIGYIIIDRIFRCIEKCSDMND